MEAIYSDIRSCNLNDGFTTKQFNLGRGVKQGCPPSGILFTIGIEIVVPSGAQLNKRHRADDRNTVKLTQYADDTTVFLRDV